MSLLGSRERLFARLAAACVFSLTLVPVCRAQVGNDNPTGPAGVFNGNVTTGCSYDPLTGNAVRSVTDLVVAGGVGAYPLAFSRVANSRRQTYDDYQFGAPGSWQHSYSWTIDGSETGDTTSFQPTYYTVSFPDGRIETFTASSTDTYFRSAPGVRERFIPLNRQTMRAYLILPDGGKIEFQAKESSVCDYELRPPCQYSYSYQPVAIYDPYGVKTVLVYNDDGSLNTITEAGGRWIQLVYVETPWTNSNGLTDVVIDHIQASDGRIVQYNYGHASYSPGTTSYTYLGNVTYPETENRPPPVASYSYQAPNVGDVNGYPLLSTAYDPMYEGPMKRIAYQYATSNGDPMIQVTAGQIDSEKSGWSGEIVSRLYIPYILWRNEIRGDGQYNAGPVRQFQYDGGLLKQASDFNNQYAIQSYDGNSYVNQVQDRNQHTTNITNEALTGRPTEVLFPQTQFDSGRPSAQYNYTGANCQTDSSNPYWVCSTKNERDKYTTYTRDARKHVTRIDYPDGGYETFSYDDTLGVVLTHRLRSSSATDPVGGLETFKYDGNGRLQEYRDPYHPAVVDQSHPEIPATANPTFSYTYDPAYRVESVTDSAGNVTNFEYTARGQVKKVTLPVDPYDHYRHTIEKTYNEDGTLQSVKDEMEHSTSFTYDDYKRPLTATLPEPAPNVSHTYYDWTGNTNTNDYSHTDANPRRVMSPSGKLVTVTTYDSNVRKHYVTTGTGAEQATMTYEYDNVGNLKKVWDPAGQSTNAYTEFFYDERNRRFAVKDPISTNRNSTGYTANWTLDPAGNKLTFRDVMDHVTTYDSYDEMNRLTHQTVPQDPSPAAITSYVWARSGALLSMNDPRAKTYLWSYDLMGRKVGATYPIDSRGVITTESWHYNGDGNMDSYKNRADATQTLGYDNRHRLNGFTWNDGTQPITTMTLDAASNLLAIENSEARVDCSYDPMNRKLTETQTVHIPGVNLANTVTYTYDSDSNRQTIQYPSNPKLAYAYTSRNQLDNLNDYGSQGTPIVKYSYDKSGNRTQRALRNGTRTDYGPADAINRIPWIQHTFASGQTGRFDYGFDPMSRLKFEQRNSGLADGFQYDSAGQLIGFQHDGALNGNGTVSSSTSAALTYDEAGNRNTITSSDPGIPSAACILLH